MFVLLVPARVPRSFAGFGTALPGGIDALPGEDAQARTGQLQEVQTALLGSEYLESRRLARWPLGRVRFTAAPGADGPGHADVFLVTHTAGAALRECWLPAPAGPLDARYIGWLRPDTPGSPAAVLHERLTAASGQVQVPPGAGDVFPFTIVRSPDSDPPLPALLAGLGPDLVRLLYLDRSSLPFKPEVTAAELRRDFCLRDGGISLLAQRSALDLRTGEQMPADPGGSLVLAPRFHPGWFGMVMGTAIVRGGRLDEPWPCRRAGTGGPGAVGGDGGARRGPGRGARRAVCGPVDRAPRRRAGRPAGPGGGRAVRDAARGDPGAGGDRGHRRAHPLPGGGGPGPRRRAGVGRGAARVRDERAVRLPAVRPLRAGPRDGERGLVHPPGGQHRGPARACPARPRLFPGGRPGPAARVLRVLGHGVRAVPARAHHAAPPPGGPPAAARRTGPVAVDRAPRSGSGRLPW